MTAPLAIDVISDVVCPWCYIGKRRLEKALALVPDLAIEVRWRPYFLNPWIPREGIDRATYLTTKFGSVEHYHQMAPRVAAAAAAEGLTYDYLRISRQPHTLDCHRLIHWTAAIEQAAAMTQRLMDLYFTEGADLTDREVLVGAAAAVGLDAPDTRARLAGDADEALITHQATRAAQAGIDGVPTYVLNGAYTITGAQDAALLAEAFRQAAMART
ncbi:MAG: DsbA family oxidoreductase [Xanthobacteraceae bacterium]|nr:MAG: DsbA family oxidoreductase [Xanthobacteraceae bacterium]